MMHKAWSSIEEVPYCFSRSSVKLEGHTALKIVKFDPNWAFPDCNSSLNSPMAMKCCTKLETAKERCPIVFQGHPSNFKVTWDKTSPILTQIGRFRTIGRSQLSNPSDLPCSRSTVKFQGHTALKIVEFDPDWAFPDCNLSLNSPMAKKLCTKLKVTLKRCPIVFSCDQAALQMVFSVCPSVRLSHLFHHVPIIVSSWNFQELLPWSKVMSMQKVKVRGQRSRSQRSAPNLAVSGL